MNYVMNWIWVLCLCLLIGTTAGESNKTTEKNRTSNTTTASISITTTNQRNKISTTASYNDNDKLVGIAVAVAICFLILITIAVIVIVWYWKRKRKEPTDETTRRNRDSGGIDLQIHALSASSLQQRNETTASSSRTTNGGKQKNKQDKGPLHRDVPNLQIPAYQNINLSTVTLSTNVEDDPVNSSQGCYENCMGREVIPDIKYQDLDDLHRRGQKTFGSRKYGNIESSHTNLDIIYDDGTYENAETIQQLATNVRTRHDNASDTDSDDDYIKPPQYYGPKKNYNSNDSDNDDYEKPIQIFPK